MMTWLQQGKAGFNDTDYQVIWKLPSLAPENVDAQRAMMSYIGRRDRWTPVAWARSLSRFNDQFAAQVMADLRKTKTSDVNALWLVTLAAMKEKAHGQLGPLAEYVNNEQDPVYRIWSRVVLASLHYDSADNIKAIEDEIKQRSHAGINAVQIAGLIGLDPWATKPMIEAMKGWLSKDIPNDAPWCAAMALGVSGKSDPIVLKNIESLLSSSLRDGGSSALIYYAYALSLLDPSQAEVRWRLILKKLGSDEFDGADIFALYQIGFSMPLQHVDLILQLTNDKDSEVASGAQIAAKHVVNIKHVTKSN